MQRSERGYTVAQVSEFTKRVEVLRERQRFVEVVHTMPYFDVEIFALTSVRSIATSFSIHLFHHPPANISRRGCSLSRSRGSTHSPVAREARV
jgi:hypothetical protein